MVVGCGVVCVCGWYFCGCDVGGWYYCGGCGVFVVGIIVVVMWLVVIGGECD